MNFVGRFYRLLGKIKRYVFCRWVVTYEYDAWVQAGNCKFPDRCADGNFRLFLDQR